MNNQRLVAIVTSASSGLGKAIALKLASDGYLVVGLARRVELMEELNTAGGLALFGDMTDPVSLQKAVETILEKFGRIDVLVNNAGFGLYGPIENVPISEARRQFEVNLFGLASLTQLVLPAMRQQGNGRIINISSMGGKVYTHFGGWYHATKHALEGWSDCLRIELAPFGIKVVVIEPGVIGTNFGDEMEAPLLKHSAGTVYEQSAKNMARSTRGSYENGKASPPSIVAEMVSKAVRAQNPRARYVGGKFAKPLIFVRKWFGDRVFDAIASGMTR